MGAGVYVGHLQEDRGIMSETMNVRINGIYVSSTEVLMFLVVNSYTDTLWVT